MSFIIVVNGKEIEQALKENGAVPPPQYYVGYTWKGPITVDDRDAAYHFPEKHLAENVINGDERWGGARIEVA